MQKFVPRGAGAAWFPCPQDMPPALHRLLVARGIASEAEAKAFLDPGPRDLHDPLLLSDMALAVGRVRAALAAGEPICVYGDYDVDGVCASAILSGWLRANGANVRVYLPSRHSEGYGLNDAAVRQIAGWAKLMVTVDCGVTNAAQVALARSLGLDVIVTDHHRPPVSELLTGETVFRDDALPECPVVNPLLNGYPFPYLCGAGVAWKLVWALSDLETAMEWVDVAALATVADVVSLTGENRVIVKLGLARINEGLKPGASRGARPGIAALVEAAGLTGKPVTSTAVAFQLAPRLNAGGRLGSASRPLALIAETDPERARALAAELEAENAGRKDIERQIMAEAEAQLEGFNFAAHRAIILAGEGWNPGVIGLAASRLVEKYNYPVVLLADQGDRLTGSCRSIEGVDIHAALTGSAHTIDHFGGHKQAAGLTLMPGMLEPFRQTMEDWLWANVDPSAYVPVRPYDAELDFEAVTPGLIAALEAVQPTGMGNPAPLFRAAAQVVEARAVGAEGAHLKLTLAQGGHRLGGIAFREGWRAGALGGGADVLFAPKLNTYMGRTEPQLEVRALADADVFARLASKLPEEAALRCEFLTEIFYNKQIAPFEGEVSEIDAGTLRGWLAERPQGTLVAAADFDTAEALLRALDGADIDLHIGEWPGDPRAFNALCVCPAKGAIPPGYERFALAGAPAECLPEGAAKAYRLPAAAPWTAELPDLDGLRSAYRALAALTKRPNWCKSMAQLARAAAEECGLPDAGAAAAILTMADMGLFELDLSARPVALRRSALAKAEPGDSAVWNVLQRWRNL